MHVADVVLDGTAIGVIATTIGAVAKSAMNLIRSRGKFRAQAADEFVTASRRLAEYSTALRAIADLLSANPDGTPASPEVCARVSALARNALGWDKPRRPLTSTPRRRRHDDEHDEDNGDETPARGQRAIR